MMTVLWGRVVQSPQALHFRRSFSGDWGFHGTGSVIRKAKDCNQAIFLFHFSPDEKMNVDQAKKKIIEFS